MDILRVILHNKVAFCVELSMDGRMDAAGYHAKTVGFCWSLRSKLQGERTTWMSFFHPLDKTANFCNSQHGLKLKLQEVKGELA